MDILWPAALLLLGSIPLLIVGYLWVLRRRKRMAVRYSSLSLVRRALGTQSRWRRHVPFGLFLTGIASLAVAVARPVAIVAVPTDQTTIILAMDVSRSMCSSDIQPSRLDAAKAAALSFIERQQSKTQMSIVAFAGFAEVVQSATRDQAALRAAVESLTVGRRTAIGSAVLKSIDAIAEIDENVAPSVSDQTSGEAPPPVPKGAYAPDIIVLLTDGASNTGPMPIDAAQQAADRGIRIYTIGFGTERGAESPPVCTSQSQAVTRLDGGGFGGFGGFGGGGGGFRRGIDEETLKQVAEMTGGSYYAASSADELQSVFENLPTYLIAKHETTELSVFFTALGALLAAAAIILALRWQPLP